MGQGAIAGQRIGLLTASASRLGGGVFEAVAAQAAMLRDLGAEPVVLALADRHSTQDERRFEGCELHHAPVLGPGFFGYAPGLGAMLDTARLDLLHLHGIWMYPSQAASAWAVRSGKPFLISPHGMLDPWITARGRWKKALARAGYERRSWRRARAFHALTGREAADIAAESGREDTLVIANAGPQAAAPPAALRPPQFAYLGRIHPKKNIAALVDAWSLLHREGALPEAASLTIAGWGDPEHVAALERQVVAAPESVRFVGPQFGADKDRLLAGARFLALPSLSEGLPMAVLEGWAAGTPVLMSSECNLPQGFEAGAALDCGIGVPSIAAALRQGFSMDERQWLAMAQAAHGLAAGQFSPAAIARQWDAAYAGLMQRGSPE